jgi:serine/threonine protein kinase
MTNPEIHCPTCGKPLASDAPMGVCPDCLLNAGLGTVTSDTGGDHPASVRPPPSPEELAPHFPQLEILGLLGRGGMGVVYKARQKALNRMVALKILAPERVRDPHFAERFAREARALAQLDHPHIVTVYDSGQAGGFYFLLMEFVDGVNLRELLRAGKLAPKEALAIVPPLCEALQFAHDRGIIHRDIKPENILLDKSGQIKIADFGIAKMVGEAAGVAAEAGAVVADAFTDQAAGTPGYMAPEQKHTPEKVDSRADIYSLGVVFYEMLTGELPKEKIEPPSSRLRGMQIDIRLDEVVLRALEKSPELRYQQASIFQTQVETIASSRGGAQVRPAMKSPPGESRYSRTALVGACWPFLVFAWVAARAGSFESVSTEPAFHYSFFISVIGTTILGWMAAWQIRNSARRLGGMGLAVLDGLLFPLLALDAFIAYATMKGIKAITDDASLRAAAGGLPPVTIFDMRHHSLVTVFLTVNKGPILLALGLMIVADAFIARAVWRAVNKPTRASGHPSGTVVATILVLALTLAGTSTPHLIQSIRIGSTTRPIRHFVALTEAPKLRYLQWAEEVNTYSKWHAWEPLTGKFVSRPEAKLYDWVALQPGVNRKHFPAPGNLAFLYLWFSHPDIDVGGFKVTLLDDSGVPMDVPDGWSSGQITGASASQELGWISVTRCLGSSAEIPPWINVRLNYSVGPWWSYLDDIGVNLREPMELSTGVQISKISPNYERKATIEITRDAARDPHTEEFSFVAMTKDGRTLDTVQGGYSPTSQSFTFDTPLDQVKTFQCRKRQIQEIVFKKVPLPPREQAAASASPVISSNPDGAAAITIHVIGGVKKPGAYQIPQGSSLLDGLKAAGGWTEMANLDVVRISRCPVGKPPQLTMHNVRANSYREDAQAKLEDGDWICVAEYSRPG